MFAVSAFGGLLFLCFGTSGDPVAYIIFVFITKFGLAGACVICYIGTNETFPVPIRATAMGVCNFVARLITIFAATCA
jgi:hypothetical protein